MNNARCPKCNTEFIVEEVKTSVCPACGVQLDTICARKYFVAFHDKSIERKTGGSDVLKLEEYLNVGAHHVSREEWEQAKDAYLSVVSINPADYRGYMGLVSVETRNYTDFSNVSHKKYLKKAISVANPEQQKIIASVYRTYNVKSSMTNEEYQDYLTEKQKDYKARVKKAILGLSRYNDKGVRKSKIALGFMIGLIVFGLLTCVLGGIIPFNLLLVPGCILMLSSFGLLVIWQRQKYNEKLYNFLVEFFNGLVYYDFNYEQTDKVLGYFASILLSIKNKDLTSQTENIIGELTEYIVETGSQKAIDFFKNNKFTAKYINMYQS